MFVDFWAMKCYDITKIKNHSSLFKYNQWGEDMLNTIMQGWVMKSLMATIIAVPFLLTAGVFGRVFKVQPEAMIFYWLLGSAAGIGVYLLAIGKVSMLSMNTQLSTVAIMGLVIGSLANILLFQAIVASPNPGMPMTIMGSNSAIAFVLGPLLAFFLPKYFQYMRFDSLHLIGIVLTIVGVGILSIHK